MDKFQLSKNFWNTLIWLFKWILKLLSELGKTKKFHFLSSIHIKSLSMCFKIFSNCWSLHPQSSLKMIACDQSKSVEYIFLPPPTQKKPSDVFKFLWRKVFCIATKCNLVHRFFSPIFFFTASVVHFACFLTILVWWYWKAGVDCKFISILTWMCCAWHVKVCKILFLLLSSHHFVFISLLLWLLFIYLFILALLRLSVIQVVHLLNCDAFLKCIVDISEDLWNI